MVFDDSKYTLIGRNHDGEKLYVEVRLDHPRDTNGPWRATVDHKNTTDRLRLSVTGVLITKYGTISKDSGWAACGQLRSELLKLKTLEHGWTVADVVKLHEIWDTWHLNDLSAGCIHQTEGMQSPDCPETGYKYGSDWLVKPLPYDVVAWITETFDVEVPEPGVTTISYNPDGEYVTRR